MLVHEASRRVVLNLRNPAVVLSSVERAKAFTYKERELVAVPHTLDAVLALRDLGFRAPSPILHYYNWPGVRRPFDAQKHTAAFLTMNPRAFVLNSMGTGKSLAALWAYDYMRSIKRFHSTIIVAPLSTLHVAWADEVFRTFPELSVRVLHGPRNQRISQLGYPADIYVVNHDGLDILEEPLAGRPDIDLVILDELATLRNAKTDRWKAAWKVCNKQVPRAVWGLTGTPTPNAPTDAWAQGRLVTPNSVPRYFGQFRDATMKQIGPFRWIPRPNAVETVRQALQPAIRFSLEDCLDLPGMIYESRDVTLTNEQQSAYTQMLRLLRVELEQGEITAVNEAVKASKLLQIACGVAYAPDGSPILLPCNPRLEVLETLVEQSEGKVLVFVPFTAVLEMVAERLHRTWPTAVVSGATPNNERTEIFRAFQSGTEPHIIVAQPGTMSHGLTLTAASTTVWYAPVYSNDIYEQANARMRRPGQTLPTVIAEMSGSRVEREIFMRLRNRQSLQGTLLAAVRAGLSD